MPDVATATRKYELFFVLLPTLTEKEVTNEIEAIKKIVVPHSEVFHEQVWGRRDLYYKMGGQTKGLYAVLCFTLDPVRVSAVRSELTLRPDILRYNFRSLPDDYVVPVRTKEGSENVIAEEALEPQTQPAVRQPKIIPVESAPSPGEPAPVSEPSVVPEVSSAPPFAESAAPDAGGKQDAFESGMSKKGKHKNLDEGLDKILNNLSSV